ncbi:hypothetical protein E4P40_13355 [Blastococcus sp. CT_GayMR20]|uniref:hypothetical protein n=1 Tax=Blastococcus sp. CT_GayMR20 TaxID=2559609 RepID=UPI00107466F6|nr:hypothetical protein [Blastococcus sp. CT_GayMR20]TFV86075.1 hypothetical protein E4P40_13355 [Blastococcus sp. CT_GayMR20]
MLLALLSLMAALLLAACGSSSGGGSDPSEAADRETSADGGTGGGSSGGRSPSEGSSGESSADQGSLETEAAEAPELEGTGPEAPGQAQAAQPSINVAGMPIGGGNGADGSAEQCVDVSFLGDDPIPRGVRITITDGSVHDVNDGSLLSDVARLGGGCGGNPSCRGFVFTAENDEAGATCAFLVTATRPPAAGDPNYDDLAVRLVVGGTVTCPVGADALCEDLRGRLEAEADDDPLGFSIPVARTEPSTEEESTEQESTEQGSTEQESTEQESTEQGSTEQESTEQESTEDESTTDTGQN